jgi:hypothetical protein
MQGVLSLAILPKNHTSKTYGFESEFRREEE